MLRMLELLHNIRASKDIRAGQSKVIGRTNAITDIQFFQSIVICQGVIKRYRNMVVDRQLTQMKHL